MPAGSLAVDMVRPGKRRPAGVRAALGGLRHVDLPRRVDMPVALRKEAPAIGPQAPSQRCVAPAKPCRDTAMMADPDHRCHATIFPLASPSSSAKVSVSRRLPSKVVSPYPVE